MCDQVSALRPAEAFEGKFLPGDEVPFSGPSGRDCVPSPTPVSEGAQSSQSWETWPVWRVPRPGERAGVRGVPTFALGRLGSKSRLCQGCFAKCSLWAPSSVSLSPALWGRQAVIPFYRLGNQGKPDFRALNRVNRLENDPCFISSILPSAADGL